MFLFENPVLQRELLVNLRTRRAALLLIGYNLALGILVFLAWPQQRRIDLASGLDEGKSLVVLRCSLLKRKPQACLHEA